MAEAARPPARGRRAFAPAGVSSVRYPGVNHAVFQKNFDLRINRHRVARAVQADQRAALQAANRHAQNIYLAPAIIQKRGHFCKWLARQVGGGVEHVRPGVKQKTTARNFWNLPPGCEGVAIPILPDCCANALEFAQLAAFYHLGGLADGRRERAIKRHRQQAAGLVSLADEFCGLRDIQHHRFSKETHPPPRPKLPPFDKMLVVRRDAVRCV